MGSSTGIQEVVMRKNTLFKRIIGLFVSPLLALCLFFPAPQALAQDGYVQEYGDQEPSGQYSREELAQMLAPIALYPDALLSQILMASTYPIEVIEADRWVNRNQGLKGEALDDALLSRDWDPSVKALCHFPSVLALMSEHITETTHLGNAFLAQEGEVMGMVQELRGQALAQGHLATTSEQKVIVERETIIIEPAAPRVIYVPYYDPYYVYGSWWYPDYPPYYWGPTGVSLGVGINYWPGTYFSFTFGSWSYFDWPRRIIYVDVHKRPRYVRHDRWITRTDRWHHAPDHRRGVAYRDKSTARKYGQYPGHSRDFGRDRRGFPEQGDRVRSRDGGLDRARSERERGGNDRARVERDRQEGPRVQNPPSKRSPAVKVERQERAVKTDRDRSERDRDQSKVQERTKKVTGDRQEVERTRVERQTPRRDNVFDRVGEGRRERDSSERGRTSRQGRTADDRDGRGKRSGSDD
ncbi:hypothetical protein DSOUD_0401 [Desulfuromonas soudanensis]|uniref:DUF3300 domain-containing protein n=2 Tax=Desulfuromonas soudanensis TaxID=1603606 RepID=A0A0M4CZ30_9BACT|nr:hypothetical protein DSOUD_0401 [Desulfuromonas soudanensis]